ncbi:MAG: hypothetical protein AMXMBFR47_44820 [Planctomycetota bacterium]
MSASAHLHLRRIRQWLSVFRKFRVILDGSEIGRIKRGTTETYEVAPGEHELVVKIDWVSAEPVTFRCEPGEHVRFVCGHPTPSWKAFLTPSQLVSDLVVVRDPEPPSTCST